MRKMILILAGFILFGCSGYKANEEADSQKRAIEQQEQRIKNLEDRLDNLENSGTQPRTKRRASLSDNAKHKGTFYIGSSEANVIEIQGTPTSIMSGGHLTMYFFGHSTVTFEDGKVKSYSNDDHNLKVKPN
jgi:hypothetical protein